MIDITIDRRKWLRGSGKFNSRLLDRWNNRCIWGFFFKGLGVPDSQMRHVSNPYNDWGIHLLGTRIHGFSFSVLFSRPEVNEIITINDDFGANDSDRERSLAYAFRLKHVNLIFIN